MNDPTLFKKMKKTYIYYSIVLISWLCAVFYAIFNFKPKGSENDIYIENSYKVKVIDSCEYIYISRRPWSSEFAITHKGNCKYCFKIRK
jgi:hypothetical protein